MGSQIEERSRVWVQMSCKCCQAHEGMQCAILWNNYTSTLSLHFLHGTYVFHLSNYNVHELDFKFRTKCQNLIKCHLALNPSRIIPMKMSLYMEFFGMQEATLPFNLCGWNLFQ